MDGAHHRHQEPCGVVEKEGRRAFPGPADRATAANAPALIQSPRVRFVRASAPVCLVRSPNSANANNARNVNSDGSLNNNNAYNGNRGVRPALVETVTE